MPTIQSSFFSTLLKNRLLTRTAQNRAATARERWLNARFLAIAALSVSTVFGQPLSRDAVRSHVNIISISGEGKREVFSSDQLFEAPNWSPDGRYLVLNSEGRLWQLEAEGGEPELIPTGAVNRITDLRII